MQELVLEIEAALEPVGFPPEAKPYHPHLTLARIKRENANVGSALMKTKALESDQHLGTLNVDRFTLFQSDLSIPLVQNQLGKRAGILPDARKQVNA